MSREIVRWCDASGRDDPTILLMGVTPELCRLPLGSRSRLVALDRGLAMIRTVWPGPLRPRDGAVCGDWACAPVASESVDFALADGCMTNLSFPAAHADFFSEVLRVLQPGGRWVVRAFVQGETRETVQEVLGDLADGRAGGFHAFKWRLAMALQEVTEAGVELASVYAALVAAAPDFDALADRCGWRTEEVRTIEAYAGLPTRYVYPTKSQLTALLKEVGFTILDTVIPSYELGCRCPTFILARAAEETVVT